MATGTGSSRPLANLNIFCCTSSLIKPSKEMASLDSVTRKTNVLADNDKHFEQAGNEYNMQIRILTVQTDEIGACLAQVLPKRQTRAERSDRSRAIQHVCHCADVAQLSALPLQH